MMKPVFVIRGIPYSNRSGGVRALHMLAKMLDERGERVIMSCESKYPLLPVDIDSKDPVVLIEPEVVGLQCPVEGVVTVRWLLNSPGKANVDRSAGWNEKDLLFHFEERFKFKDSQPLCVPHVNEDIFHNRENPDDGNRDVDCFYSHKAAFAGEKRKIVGRAYDISPNAGIIAPGDWDTLASLFRKTRTLYTMEETATAIEAALCGAQVVYLPNGYMPEPPKITDHIAWYRAIIERSESEVDNFVDICYKRTGISVWRSTIRAVA